MNQWFGCDLVEQSDYTVHDYRFRKITISLALASFFVFASMYAVQPLLPVFVDAFGVSVSTSSLAVSLTIVGLIVGLMMLGFLSDRHGRTMFIKFSLAGSVIPFLLIPLSDSFIFLLVLRLLQGFALAGLPAAAIAYINEEIDRYSVGVATALYISSNALGGMMGRVLAGYMTEHFSWQTAFYFLAGIGLAILLAVFIMLPQSRHFRASNLSFAKDIEAFLFHLKNPSLLLIFGLGVVLQFSFTGIWTYLPFHLETKPFSMSIQAISNMFFAYGLGIIGSPLAGWLADKFGLRPVRVAGIITMAIGLCMTLSPSIVMVVIGLCVACLGFFTAHSLTAASVGEQATHHKGSASSLYLVAYYIGVALGSSVLGPWWSITGWVGLVLFTAILPVAYLLFVHVMQGRFRKNKRNRGEA